MGKNVQNEISRAIVGRIPDWLWKVLIRRIVAHKPQATFLPPVYFDLQDETSSIASTVVRLSGMYGPYDNSIDGSTFGVHACPIKHERSTVFFKTSRFLENQRKTEALEPRKTIKDRQRIW